jgi:FixJ family two-component response regulator
MSSGALVSVVDDGEPVHEPLPHLLRELGYAVQVYGSAEEFLVSAQAKDTQCLILDVFLRGMTAPQFIRELVHRRLAVPTLFITAHCDEALRSRLLSEGAVECLFKPFSDSALIAALDAAMRIRHLH